MIVFILRHYCFNQIIKYLKAKDLNGLIDVPKENFLFPEVI